MFGNNPKSSASNSHGTTLIAKGTEISGQITFSGSLEIEGVVRGNIVVEQGNESAQVRIQKSGEVFGDICAPVVIVNSSVEGNVYSSKRVELAANAVVCGDVHYQIIEMVKGAQVNGGLLYTNEARQVSASAEDKTGTSGFGSDNGSFDSGEILEKYVDSGLSD